MFIYIHYYVTFISLLRHRVGVGQVSRGIIICFYKSNLLNTYLIKMPYLGIFQVDVFLLNEILGFTLNALK